MLKKYTEDEIERIFNERVTIAVRMASLKKAMIGEWTFTYPTGYKTVEIELAAPMNEEDYDHDVAYRMIVERVKSKLWEICGKYTLATGDKL